jgi:hypothetical protein
MCFVEQIDVFWYLVILRHSSDITFGTLEKFHDQPLETQLTLEHPIIFAALSHGIYEAERMFLGQNGRYPQVISYRLVVDDHATVATHDR